MIELETSAEGGVSERGERGEPLIRLGAGESRDVSAWLRTAQIETHAYEREASLLLTYLPTYLPTTYLLISTDR